MTDRITRYMFVLAMAMAVAAIASCSSDSDMTDGQSQQSLNREMKFDVDEIPLFADNGITNGGTRASKVTSVSSFKLYAYNSSGTAIINGATYTKSGSSWTTSGTYYWPQSGAVTFYAFSPASNSAVSFNTSTKQLTYTAPTAQASQQDVLYAYTSASRPSDNTASLTFHHANAAFSVNARLASGCTATVNVSGVQLVNIKPTNTITMTSNGTAASGSNISTALAVSAKNLTTSNQAISSAPLMLPPQSVTAWSGSGSLSNTYLAVTCKVLSGSTYYVGSASANGTVYVPMSKALVRGQEATVNLVFGTLSGGNRTYGRNSSGTLVSVADAKTTSTVTSSDLGKVICTDGTIYDTKALATAAGKTAAAMIAYVSGTGHGIAVALTDANSGNSTTWANAVTAAANYTPTVSGYTWKLPSANDWDHMFASFGGTAYSGSEHSDGQSWSYGNFRSKLTACGGTDVQSRIYWSSTVCSGNSGSAWGYYFGYSGWYWYSKSGNRYVRSCFAF